MLLLLQEAFPPFLARPTSVCFHFAVFVSECPPEALPKTRQPLTSELGLLHITTTGSTRPRGGIYHLTLRIENPYF